MTFNDMIWKKILELGVEGKLLMLKTEDKTITRNEKKILNEKVDRIIEEIERLRELLE